MRLSFAYSPCPNDTFMFGPLANRLFETGDYTFDIHLLDIEQLNVRAIAGLYDITKLSFNAFTHVHDKYQLLHSGSALGKNCGPILISSKPIDPKDIDTLRIAIPGEYTTANFLLKYAYPKIRNTEVVLFSEIEKKILEGSVDAGVIIHENRFTYESKGLIKVLDLGEHWEKTTLSPIPLGGIAIKRSLENSVKRDINTLIRRSVDFAFKNPESCNDYISHHAQEMQSDVVKAHIALYVNEFSRSLGKDGKKAIQVLFNTICPTMNTDQLQSLFVEE